MNAPLKAVAGSGNVEVKLDAAMREIGRDARGSRSFAGARPGLAKESSACRHGQSNPRRARRDP